MALIHGRGTHIELKGPHKGLKYSINVDDYQEMCKSCHVLYDESASHPCSPEQRKKISEKLKGRKRPDISEMFKGKRTESSKLGWERRRQKLTAEQISESASRAAKLGVQHRKERKSE